MKLYMTNQAGKLEEQGNVKRTNTTTSEQLTSWQVGTYHARDTAPALAIWPAGVEPQSNGIPICLISPLDTITEFDLINAQLIMAVPVLYNAAVALIDALEGEGKVTHLPPRPELEMLKKAVDLATRKTA